MRWSACSSVRGSFCVSLTLLVLAVTDLPAQSFVPAGKMTRPRTTNSATLLQDGRVLIVGGDTTPELPPTAEIYDPVSGTFVETGAPTVWRGGHGAVLLRDGRVLFMGGSWPFYLYRPTAIAELYNPDTGTFTRTGNMSVAQLVLSAVLLKNGKVLVLGAITAELYDPATGTFASLNSGGVSPYDSPPTLLPDGTVLVPSYSGLLLYDPVNKVFTRTSNTPIPLEQAPVTPLLDGSVLFAGGDRPGSYGDGAQAQSLVYDPGTQALTPGGNLTLARGLHTATLLKDGRVLIAGGYNGEGSDAVIGMFASAELYDPATGTFSRTENMLTPRFGHTATLLRDGRVLITGGWSGVDTTPITGGWSGDATAQLFVPESTQGDVPRVTLDWSRYCVGDSWILRAEEAAPSTSVQISGTFDGTPWTIPDWATTGQGGTLLATGTYAANAVGDYTLWLYTGGKVSNTVRVGIDTCPLQLELNSNFHVGDSWTAHVMGALPGANVTLLGISGTAAWTIESWGQTDSGGTFVTSGNFPPYVEGDHELRAVVGGALSNAVRFSVRGGP